MLAGDRDRERAAFTLREHYVRGRLTLDEFSNRTARVLAARSKEELWHALSDLPQGLFPGVPVILDTGELAAQGRAIARAAGRVAALALFTGAYLLFTCVLLVVFGLTLLIHGASASLMVGFLVVWLVPTWLLARLWQRRPPHRRAGA
jgi:Flp pilus assembly protein TadB